MKKLTLLLLNKIINTLKSMAVYIYITAIKHIYNVKKIYGPYMLSHLWDIYWIKLLYHNYNIHIAFTQPKKIITTEHTHPNNSLTTCKGRNIT